MIRRLAASRIHTRKYSKTQIQCPIYEICMNEPAPIEIEQKVKHCECGCACILHGSVQQFIASFDQVVFMCESLNDWTMWNDADVILKIVSIIMDLFCSILFYSNSFPSICILAIYAHFLNQHFSSKSQFFSFLLKMSPSFLNTLQLNLNWWVHIVTSI